MCVTKGVNDASLSLQTTLFNEVRNNRRFTISALLSMEFPEVSSLYSIVKEHLGYKKHKNSLATTFHEEGIGGSLFTGTTNAWIVKVIMSKSNHNF